MIVDGKALAERIYADLKNAVTALPLPPRLGILTCAPNFETEKYLNLKEKKATSVGVETIRSTHGSSATTDELVAALHKLVEQTDGIVVQLPLPPTVDANVVLHALPSTHDVDALKADTTEVLSPVVGAIAEILKVHNVPLPKTHVVVVGSGRLVGRPAAHWFMEHGASVSIVTRSTVDIPYYTKNADIIVLGAGVPGLLTSDMVKEGVIILDAGTSEDGGVLVGDADPQCAPKASLFTPVPGGIGPMTIAILLRNLVSLITKH
jgi:methylenetetrahydrofolate dehydrogenase (NADP+)/methenyltetrahydrofolate cyclohydrolase